MSDPHKVTRDFEAALCAYTGAKYAVTTTSCTQAILMAAAYSVQFGSIVAGMPKLSYVGVPASLKNAGFYVAFRDEDWQGEYLIDGLRFPLWDSARRFTSGMYRPGSFCCVSFHSSKILADTQGGAILHDNEDADAWLRRARFDGRTEGVDPRMDQVQFPSWHAYLSCDVAARLLWKLSLLPKHNADLPRSDYQRLDLLDAFK